jgi:hypothetical protein
MVLPISYPGLLSAAKIEILQGRIRDVQLLLFY